MSCVAGGRRTRRRTRLADLRIADTDYKRTIIIVSRAYGNYCVSTNNTWLSDRVRRRLHTTAVRWSLGPILSLLGRQYRLRAHISRPVGQKFRAFRQILSCPSLRRPFRINTHYLIMKTTDRIFQNRLLFVKINTLLYFLISVSIPHMCGQPLVFFLSIPSYP